MALYISGPLWIDFPSVPIILRRCCAVPLLVFHCCSHASLPCCLTFAIHVFLVMRSSVGCGVASSTSSASHGGFSCGLIVATASSRVIMLGNCCARFSRVEQCFIVLVPASFARLMPCQIQICIGWPHASVWSLVAAASVLSWSRIHGGFSPVSASIAAVGVVW